MEAYILYSDGTIFSKNTNKYLKPRLHRDGYLLVAIKRKNYTVHRLVAQKFIPNPYNLPCVNHKDGNRQNNNVNNLEWCDHINNTQSWNKLNTNFGNITIRERGSVRHQLVIYGKSYSKYFDDWCEAEFYRLILKYAFYKNKRNN